MSILCILIYGYSNVLIDVYIVIFPKGRKNSLSSSSKQSKKEKFGFNHASREQSSLQIERYAYWGVRVHSESRRLVNHRLSRGSGTVLSIADWRESRFHPRNVHTRVKDREKEREEKRERRNSQKTLSLPILNSRLRLLLAATPHRETLANFETPPRANFNHSL